MNTVTICRSKSGVLKLTKLPHRFAFVTQGQKICSACNCQHCMMLFCVVFKKISLLRNTDCPFNEMTSIKVPPSTEMS